MVPQAISIGISMPINMRIIIGTVAILQPWRMPSSILFHFIPVAIRTMTAKVMAKTRVICISGEFPVASCAIITKNINEIIAKEVTKDGFFIDCSFIFLVSCAFSGQPSPFFFFLDYIRRRFYLLFYALFYSPFIL